MLSWIRSAFRETTSQSRLNVPTAVWKFAVANCFWGFKQNMRGNQAVQFHSEDSTGLLAEHRTLLQPPPLVTHPVLTRISCRRRD